MVSERDPIFRKGKFYSMGQISIELGCCSKSLILGALICLDARRKAETKYNWQISKACQVRDTSRKCITSSNNFYNSLFACQVITET
jgi:hypothetical protein